MTFKPGHVVVLKSGGLHMTVAEVSGDDVHCIWLGDDGELFRDTLPEAVLDLIPSIGPEDEEDEDEDEENDEEDGDDAEDEDDDKAAARAGRRVA